MTEGLSEEALKAIVDGVIAKLQSSRKETAKLPGDTGEKTTENAEGTCICVGP